MLETVEREVVKGADGLMPFDSALRSATARQILAEDDLSSGLGELILKNPGVLEDMSLLKRVVDIRHMALDARERSFEDVGPPRAAIVLGYKLKEDGSPDLIMVNRLQTAVDLFERGNVDKIVLSGGMPNGVQVSEAGVMHDLLRSNGFDMSQVIVEDASRDTIENAKRTIEVLESDGISGGVVCTSGFHVRRAEYIFRKAALEVESGMSFVGLGTIDGGMSLSKGCAHELYEIGSSVTCVDRFAGVESKVPAEFIKNLRQKIGDMADSVLHSELRLVA